MTTKEKNKICVSFCGLRARKTRFLLKYKNKLFLFQLLFKNSKRLSLTSDQVYLTKFPFFN